MASISIRDNQRQKVYDSEALAFEGRTERGTPYDALPEYKTVAECQQFVSKVVSSSTWKHLCPFGPEYVTVADGRGRRRAGASGGRITIPRFARRRWYLLHELAHVATPAEEWAPHGPQYVFAYLHLVSRFLGPRQHAALTSAMASYRVKVCDYMGSGVYDGTTVRHVTATDTVSQSEPPSKAKALGEARLCDVCGMVLSRLRRGRFCSDVCRWTYHNGRRPLRTVDTREKVCATCGTEFVAKRADTKTCSPACRQKAYRRRRGT